ncbi:MAG: hypothetical protein K1X72_12165 [Pyrinomonadaceae bacterium]|nr:hypothetical protein [Pyrinomonadaceae bacterium]
MFQFQIRNPLILWLVLLGILLFLPNQARAQGGPPMITDDTGTVPKGHWEINSAFTIERGSDGRVLGTPLLDINYGLSKNTQLKVEIPWLVVHRNGQKGINGLGNTNIGVRWRFRDETKDHRIALSIYPQFEFNNPTSSVRRGIVDRGPEFLMPLQWQTQVGKYGINGDVGYRFKRGTDELIYGVVVGRRFRDAVEILGEIHGTGERNALNKSEIVYNLGTRIKINDNLNLITSAGKSIRKSYDPRFIGYLGMQITF